MMLYIIKEDLQREDRLLKLQQLSTFLTVQFGGEIVKQTEFYIVWHSDRRFLSKDIYLGKFVEHIKSIHNLNDDVTPEQIEQFVTIIHAFQNEKLNFVPLRDLLIAIIEQLYFQFSVK